ncbi:MAG: NAD(+) synthase [Clostridia bacterium]|nr:NAD(+) synthase [Clostridia bacterium]
MKYGFLRVSAVTPEIKVADCDFNKKSIIDAIQNADKNKVKLAVFPELCVTGATCGDLFLQDTLLNAARKTVSDIAEETAKMDIMSVLGLPLLIDGGIYNCAVVIHKGKILAIIPKKSEYAEKSCFLNGQNEPKMVDFGGQNVPFGADIIVCDTDFENFRLAVEIGNRSFDKGNATVIVKLLSSRADVSDGDFSYDFNRLQSQKFSAAIICADAGYGESTTDVVLSGKNMIFEAGKPLCIGKKFVNDAVTTEIDVDAIAFLKRKSGICQQKKCFEVKMNFEMVETPISRNFDKLPFVKTDAAYFEEAIGIQTTALCKRLEHTGTKNAVIGVSGGLDSTMALLVTVRAFDRLGLDRKNILAITMPCFGTTKRTHDNAETVSKRLGVSFKEISIKDTVKCHFKDINQPEEKYDAAYENAQARERTQVLMDIANQIGGIAVGTGDMSELALGWATYNGDHMSMYGVNCGIPKTLMRFLVEYESDRIGDKELKSALSDILDTPVSPELLPADRGQIVQKTENAVGPYILHDFFLYNMLVLGFSPKKIQYVAEFAFKGEFSREEINKWLKIFVKRFFSQQFKRSCSPDGPQVLGISLSPRGGLTMPSDARCKLWFAEIDE